MTSISITFELGRCLSQELLSHIYHLNLRSVLIPRYPFSQSCTFSLRSERMEILSWASCVSSWMWWVAMVLQEGCRGVGGDPNGETSLKKPCPWLQPALSYLIIPPSIYREENRETRRTAVEGLRQQCMHGREGCPFQGCPAYTPQGCNGAGWQHELQGHCVQAWPQPWCETTAKQPLSPSHSVIFSPPSFLFLFSAQTLHSSQLPHARAAMRAL